VVLPGKQDAEEGVDQASLGDSLRNSSAQQSWTLVSTFTLALIIAAGAVLRFLVLARKPFWFDEAFSVVIARLSWHDFVRLLWWREANMSLYYLLLRGWLGFHVNSGFSPFFIRSFSVLASLATLPAIFWLGSKLYDRRVGLIAAALLSCNGYDVRYAQEARSYSLFVLLATLSSGFFVVCLREPSRRNHRGYGLSSVLAVYAHLYALLLVAAQWLSVRGLEKKQPPDPASRAAILPVPRSVWIWIGLAVLPLLAFVSKTGAGAIRWIPRPGVRELLDYAEHLAGNGGPPLLLLYVAASLAAIVPLGGLFGRGAGWDVWRRQFLLIWLLFPVALTVLLSLARPVFLARYLVFCLPALIVLAAAGLARLRKAWLLAICLTAMLLLSLRGTFSYYDHDFDLERDGSEAAANYIYEHAQPGDAILFHIAEARVPFEFFSSLRRNARGGLATGPEIIFPRHGNQFDYRDVTGNPTADFLRSVPGRYSRVWVVLMRNGGTDKNGVGQPDAATLILNQTLAETFPRVERAQFPQVEIELYSKP
jgi:mannosyltransferase